MIFYQNINMECWNLTFNAQGLKVIIVVIHVGSMKIFVTTMEAFKKKERHAQFTTKINGFLNFNALQMCVCVCFFFNKFF